MSNLLSNKKKNSFESYRRGRFNWSLNHSKVLGTNLICNFICCLFMFTFFWFGWNQLIMMYPNSGHVAIYNILCLGTLSQSFSLNYQSIMNEIVFPHNIIILSKWFHSITDLTIDYFSFFIIFNVGRMIRSTTIVYNGYHWFPLFCENRDEKGLFPGKNYSFI